MLLSQLALEPHGLGLQLLSTRQSTHTCFFISTYCWLEPNRCSDEGEPEGYIQEVDDY